MCPRAPPRNPRHGGWAIIRRMALTVSRTQEVDEFLASAGAFLAEREAEHNLLLGICGSVKRTPDIFGDDPPRFAVATDESLTVLGATVQTPPFNLVLSCVDDPTAIDALADALTGDPLPGVLGPKQVVARFVERWTAATGRSAELETAERIYRLERVIPPRPASGSWRIAEAGDRELLARWLLEFRAEAVPNEPAIRDALAVADRWVARVNRIGYLWIDGGEPVCMVGAGGETPNGVRIGPVYTPPEFRGRGYASNLTAVTSQEELDAGRRFVFLFTNLANATSNKIYRSIGYEPVCDIDQYRIADA